MTRDSAGADHFRPAPEDLAPSDIDAATLELIRTISPFDIGCTAALPGHGAAGRCQLWAGHEGPHAVLFVHADERVVQVWQADDARDAREGSEYRTLPWARRFPQPAWHEYAIPTDGDQGR